MSLEGRNKFRYETKLIDLLKFKLFRLILFRKNGLYVIKVYLLNY